MTTIPAATVWSVAPGLDIHVREAGFAGTDRPDQLTSVADLSDAYTRLLDRFTPAGAGADPPAHGPTPAALAALRA